jgi:beta-N-acetylhexosaminidase
MRIVVLMMMVLVGMIQARVSDRMIANMFVLGFEGRNLTSSSPIVRAVCDQGLGGVILFKKNVATAGQVRAMTRQLSRCPHKPLIAVDQEGGKVRRIRFGHEYGRASDVARVGVKKAREIYGRMGQELHRLGINYNLAPVADLDIQPRNYIIHKLGRSYGRDPQTVTAYNNAFIRAMHQHRVLTSLKHFPGHGSSLGDTHQGFVDVTEQWQDQELTPFLNPKADSVMVAHVVNQKITEPGRPASLSPRAIRTLRKGNANVVVITDDLQMGAIRKHYRLKETIRLAIKAGNDLLLFGNQLSRKDKVDITKLVAMVRSLMQRDKSIGTAVRSANRRIARMRRKIGLRDGKISPARSHKKPRPSAGAADMF